jgi:DNA-binding NarL/FixJ family response regulator
MCSLIRREADIELVAEAGTGEQAIEEAAQLQPDVVVMDILLPGMTGIGATAVIVQRGPQTKVIALSNHSGRRLWDAVLKAGGMGYVRKDHAFEELIPAIRAVCAGERFLGKQVEEW